MPFGFHGADLLVVLVVALLIFGPKKLPEMGEAIGKGIRQFKKATSEITEPEETKYNKSLADLEAIEREIADKRAAAEAELRAAEEQRRAAEAERQQASTSSEPQGSSEPVEFQETSNEPQSSKAE